MKDFLPQSGKEGSVTYKLHFFIASVAEHLQVILNHERDGIIVQAFLAHNQPAHTTVPVLKQMNLLKPDMEIQDFFKSLFFFCVRLNQQFGDLILFKQ